MENVWESRELRQEFPVQEEVLTMGLSLVFTSRVVLVCSLEGRDVLSKFFLTWLISITLTLILKGLCWKTCCVSYGSPCNMVLFTMIKLIVLPCFSSPQPFQFTILQNVWTKPPFPGLSLSGVTALVQGCLCEQALALLCYVSYHSLAPCYFKVLPNVFQI